MFYHNLGGSVGNNLTGNQTIGDVTLTDIQSFYWSGTEFNSIDAWSLFFNDGASLHFDQLINFYGWAVRSGDVVSAVPAAVWLFGSGLIGLIGVGKRKRH